MAEGVREIKGETALIRETQDRVADREAPFVARYN